MHELETMFGLKRLLTARSRLRRHRRIVLASRLFDAGYYARVHGLPFYRDAASHFCATGWRKGLDPSEFFDVAFYLATYGDIRRTGTNPLVHYLTGGAAELRQPSPNFDPRGFCDAHPDVDPDVENPAEACLERYGTYFWNGQSPAAALPDDAVAEFRPHFDPDFYRSTNSDVVDMSDPYRHFVLIGQYEDRDPSPGFDTLIYRRKLASESGLLANPVYHYLRKGRAQDIATALPDEICLDPTQTVDPAGSGTLRVGVHAHCFYPELVGEMIPGFANLPATAKVVVTVVTAADQAFVRHRLAAEALPQEIEVRVVPNRGRDLGPFLVGCRDLWEELDVVLHVHAKVSPHVPWGHHWRHYLLDQTLGSRGLVEAAIARFAAEPELGCLYPRNFFRIRRYLQFERNEAAIDALLGRVGLSRPDLAQPDYPAGSMAWYRTAPMRALVRGLVDLESFDLESQQLDNTLAHALERTMPLVVRASGYRVRGFTTPRRTALVARPGFPTRESSVAPAVARWRRDTPAIATHPPLPLAPLSRAFNRAALDIHWIIPSFVKGGGGHMTIFRMVEFLERFGHRQTVWLQNPIEFGDQGEAKLRIQQWFRPVGERVLVRFLPEDVREISADVLIATDCWTAFPAALVQNVKERFYFVQDDEPSFHPTGDLQLIAEATYGFGFAALCAGAWLLDKMRARGLWARSWDLSADREVYRPGVVREPGGTWRIAFYARGFTPRRAVYVGLAAFALLHRRGVPFHVDLFGEELKATIDFPHTLRGVLEPEELGELYRASDLGIVFSTTNYSLIPLEMMACELPVVEIDGPSTRAIFKDGEATLAAPTPYGIADAIEALMADPDRRAEQRRRGRAFVDATSWEESARAFEAAMLERLEELGHRAIDPMAVLAAPALGSRRRATVFVPTYNAGPAFEAVLERLVRQRCDFAYDVLVIDSQSQDGTFDLARRFADRGVRAEQIEASAFQHGRTRNLGIGRSEADYVAIITQDALPADDGWLSALIGGFAAGPRVAGVIGRHAAYPEHDAFAHRDMAEMFDTLARLPRVIDREVGLPSFYYPGGRTWRMLSQFYSDNNSAMSRAAWKVLPYPEIDWGEDQVWADEALRLGFQKAYVDEAIVYHSHAFDLDRQYRTSMTEGRFWADRFGFDLHPDPAAALAAMNARDSEFALRQGLDQATLKARHLLNRAVVEGRSAGYRAAGPFPDRAAPGGRGPVDDAVSRRP